MKELTAATTRNSPCWKPIAPAVILKPWRIWWRSSSAIWRKKFCGGLQIDHKDAEGNVLYTIDLSRPWKRADYQDLIRGVAGEDWFDISPKRAAPAVKSWEWKSARI